MDATISEIMNADEFEVYALRVIDGPAPAIGATPDASRIWIDGTPTDDYLDGVSAVNINGSIDRALRIAADYYGSTVLLVAGFSYSYGEDDGEVVIRDARVLATWIR